MLLRDFSSAKTKLLQCTDSRKRVAHCIGINHARRDCWEWDYRVGMQDVTQEVE